MVVSKYTAHDGEGSDGYIRQVTSVISPPLRFSDPEDFHLDDSPHKRTGSGTHPLRSLQGIPGGTMVTTKRRASRFGAGAGNRVVTALEESLSRLVKQSNTSLNTSSTSDDTPRPLTDFFCVYPIFMSPCLSPSFRAPHFQGFCYLILSEFDPLLIHTSSGHLSSHLPLVLRSRNVYEHRTLL